MSLSDLVNLKLILDFNALFLMGLLEASIRHYTDLTRNKCYEICGCVNAR